jgi:uncharacterized protein (DUF58 family)
MTVYHGFMKSKGAGLWQGMARLRPTARLLICVALGGLPLLVAGPSGHIFAWSAGWNTLIALLLVLDSFSLLRPVEIDVERSGKGQIQARQILHVEYFLRSDRDILVEMVDELPPQFECVSPPDHDGFRLSKDRMEKRFLLVKPQRRGLAEWGFLNFIIHGQLGLLSRRYVVSPRGLCSVRVLPRLNGLDAAYLDPRLVLAELGLKPKVKRGDGSEFHRIREAQPGDSLRRIDWRAKARTGKTMVREYRPELCDDVILCLDHGRLMGGIHGDRASKLDHAIDAVLRFALLALNAGDRVGFVSFAETPGLWIKPKTGRSHLGTLMMAIYDLATTSSDANHAAVMLQIAKRQSKRALIVLFTDFVDLAASDEMLRALRILKQRHRVLFVGVLDPVTRELVEQEMNTDHDALLSMAALHQDVARDAVVQQVRALGIDALDLAPAELASSVINSYLKIRARGIS